MDGLKNYGRNIWLWLRGFPRLWTRRNDYRSPMGRPAFSTRIGQTIQYQPGWGPWKFLPVYLFDVGFTVLIAAGAVEPLSTFMNRHRAGWLNDAVLDAIERFDADHGANSGKAL